MSRTPGLTATGSVAGAVGAAFVSGAAALCCIGPLGLTLLGVNGMILAAALKPYRFHLLGVSAILLAAAVWATHRRAAPVDRSSCSTRSRRVTVGLLWLSTVVWLAAFLLQFIADNITL